MKNTKIIVTSGVDFIGSNLARKLSEDCYKAIIIVIFVIGFKII